MRRQGSTSKATLQGEGAMPRAFIRPAAARPAGRRGGRLALTTALVGVGLCLMLAPVRAETLLLHGDEVGDGAIITWNTANGNRVWQAEGGGPALSFDNGDTIILEAFGTTGMTLHATQTVRPQAIRIRSSEYTITGNASGLLRGPSGFGGGPLTFTFEGAGNSLAVDAAMAGRIVVQHAAGASGGRLTYGGSAETERVELFGGVTLEVTGDLDATGGSESGFVLRRNATLDIAAGGSAAGDVTRNSAGAIDTALIVEGQLDGSVSDIASVTVAGEGVVTGGIATGDTDTVTLAGTGAAGVTVGQVSGTGTVTIEGDVTGTGLGGDGQGALIGAGGRFHAVNGGGTFTTGLFESAGILGSANAADGVTGITADVIRLTGGSIAGDVAFDGALEVGNLGPAGVELDGNDTLRDTLTVLAGGRVSIAAGTASFDAGGVTVVIQPAGRFTASENVTNVAAVQSSGALWVLQNKSLTTGAVTLTGNGSAVVFQGGTLTSASDVQLQGGTLTVSGTVTNGVVATGGRLLLTGGTIGGTVSLAAEAELAGTVGDLVLEAGAASAHAATTTGNLTADSVTQKGGTLTIAGGTTLDSSGTPIAVESGQLVVAGTAGDVAVTGGALRLEGGTLGAVDNSGTAVLHGTVAALDNKAAGNATIDGALLVSGPGPITNAGTLTLAGAGVLSSAGAASLVNGGTLYLEGTAANTVVDNAGVIQVRNGRAGTAQRIDNSSTVNVQAGGTLTVAGGVGNTGAGTTRVAGELVGNVTGGGVTVTATGKVTGDVASAGAIQSAGEVTGTLAASGTATVSGRVGTLRGEAGGTVTMSNAVAGNDLTLGALVNDGAAMTVASNAGVTVTGGAGNGAGSLTLHGNLDVSGATGGRLDNAATLSVTGGTLTGDLRQTGGTTTVSQTGSITGTAGIEAGTLTLNGTAGGLALTGGSATVGANGCVTGATSVAGGVLTANGTLAGLTVSAGSATVAATGSAGATGMQGGTLEVAGRLASLTQTGGTTTIATGGRISGNATVNGGSLISAGTITGNLTNNAAAQLRGAIGGSLLGSGATTTTGDLSLGGGFALAGGSLTIDPGHRVTLAEGSGGTLSGNAQLIVRRGTLAGDVTLDSAGATLALRDASRIEGDVTSSGRIEVTRLGATITGSVINLGVLTGTGLANTLTIEGDLDNQGSILSGGGKLTITVTGYYERNSGGTLGVGVTIIGDVRNSVLWNIDDDQALAGNLLNAATGVMNVAGTLSMAGYNLTNDGTLAVLSTAAGGGAITDIGTLTNNGGLSIAAGSTVEADQIVNAATGVLTSAGTITGALTNQGDATLAGGVTTVRNTDGGVLRVAGGTTLATGQLTNQSGSRVIVDGILAGPAENQAGGIFTSTGQLAGGFANHGTATLSGLAGAVLNAGGTLALGGDLSVASLVNRAGLTVGAGRTLTLAGGEMENGPTGNMSVLGVVSGTVANTGTLLVAASGSVSDLVNGADGTTTLRGAVTGLLTNLAGGTVEVTAPTAQVADMDNRGHLRVGAAGHLTATGIVATGGTARITGALTAATLRNTGTLTSSGTVTAAVENLGTAQVSGHIAGSYTNIAGTTAVVRSLTLTGPMAVQGGTVQVKAGATLAADTPVAVAAAGRLTVAGRIEGIVDNAGRVVTHAGSRIMGTLVNNGTAQLAGRVDSLDSTGAGTVFVHADLAVDTLASAGRLTVAAGNAMTVGTGVVAGETIVAGSLGGAVENRGRVVARGTVEGMRNAVGGRIDLIGGTLADVVNDGEVQVSQAARIGAGGLENNALLRLTGSARLAIDSQLHNTAAGEMVVAAGAQATGPILNDGLLTSSGALSGGLTNNGTARLGGAAGDVVNDGLLQSVGTLTVASLTNNDRLRIGAGSTLRSDAELVTAAGGTSTVNGTLDAAMLVQSGGTLVSTGRLQRDLTVEGEASLSGRAATVVTEAGSSVRVTGDLQVDRLSNAGDTVVQAGTVLTPVTLENLAGGALTVAGRVQGSIDNAGQLIGANGSVSGDVILRSTGTITGVLNIEGQLIIATLAPVPAGAALFSAPATETFVALDARGPVLFNVGPLDAPLDDTSVIEEGSVVVLNDGAMIETTGDLTVLGTLVANTTNEGVLTIGAPGLVQGNILTSGSFSLAGNVNGSVTFAGGSMSFAPTGTISGDLVLAADHGFASGETVRAGRLVVDDGVEMSLAGAGPGSLTVDGDLVNNGTLALDNGALGDVVTVTGGLSGDGIYRLDTDIGLGTADRVDVTGGPVSGRLTFDIRDAGSTAPDFGQMATLLSWDTAYSGSNSFTLADPVNLPEPTERVIYLVAADDAAGEIQLISAANPAVGAISGNIVLTQSLIGTVINRPSSPYTTGIGFEADRACRVGSWGRAVGGNADASGATRGATLPNGNRIEVESEISATYRGFQVGTDLGCYDGRFHDWTVIGGAIMGMNTGSTTQPVYKVNPLTGRATSEMTSVNDADFDQKYAGLYLSAMKGAWVVDLQVRREWTEFSLNNTPQPGLLGLQLTDAEFDSRATTVSGSVGYSMPLGGADSGWSLTPTAGFAWTKTSTDTIVFDDNSTLELDDSQTKIGFVGAGLSRTRLAADGRSAVSLFASGTYYKDFAKPVESTFTLMHPDGTTSSQRLSSDNLGSFGEVSLGASYVRLMDGAGPVKQLNATIRVDGRTGSTLDSYGITGQLRLQF